MSIVSFFRRASIIILILGTLWAISRIQAIMNRIREAEELTHSQPLMNAPPIVAFTTIAAGGFRGLLADFLFLRLQAMQDREGYFEIVQLASWIVKLQPRFTAATVFLAWNMAYNVSVVFNDPDDRWRWIQHGITLLRDEALTYNPGSPTIYRELGWIYQHKLGQALDNAHLYYKAQLAKRVISILGNQERYNWAKLAATSANHDELIQDLGEPASKLQRILKTQNTTLAKLEFNFRKNENFDSKMKKELVKNGLHDNIETYFRARWLKAELKLDPKIINELIKRYGSLDFRLPDAHAIYWATMGLKYSKNDQNIAACERMIFQSLKNAFAAGKFVQLLEDSVIYTMPNITLVDGIIKAYVEALRNNNGNSTIVVGYENFMKDAIVILYLFGEKRKAAEFLQIIRQTSETTLNNRFQKGLDDFVLLELSDDIDSISRQKALILIQSLILHSLNSLALGENNRSEGFDLMAKKIYQLYMKRLQNDRELTRRGLPEYSVIKGQCYNQFKETPLVPIIENHKGDNSDHNGEINIK